MALILRIISGLKMCDLPYYNREKTRKQQREQHKEQTNQQREAQRSELKKECQYITCNINPV